MSERTPIRDPRQLTSLLKPFPLDFRPSSQWEHRYSPESKPHWQNKANKLRDFYQGNEEIAGRLFLIIPPKEKKQLIELMSYFGNSEDSVLAADMIASSMQRYFDPGGGAPIAEQRAFYEGEMPTTPDILLHALDMYFDSIQQNEEARDFMEVSLSIRTNADPQRDPRFEQDFLLKQLNAIERGVRHNHYQKNKVIYNFFGLTYNEEKGQLQKSEKYTPPPMLQRGKMSVPNLSTNEGY